MMHIVGRRDFLVNSVVATAVACTDAMGAPPGAGGVAPSNRTVDLKQASARLFSPLIGQSFLLVETRVKFRLDSVQMHRNSSGKRPPANVRQEPFTLILSAPDGTALDAAIHKLSHPALGNMDVFINQVRVCSVTPTSSPLGQAEMFLKQVAANTATPTPRVHYQIAFN